MGQITIHCGTSFQRYKSLTAIIIFSLLLAGCTTLTPTKVTNGEVAEFASEKLDNVTKNQEPVSGPIGLYEAMARALKYNRDFQVEIANKTLRARELEIASYKDLPELVSTLDYNGRDNFSGGSSQSLQTGVESLEPSTSSEKNVLATDLKLSFNVLDFGLSYVKAKQAANEVLIAEELKRKTINKIIEDVRTAYWRALGSQRVVNKLGSLKKRAAKALRSSERLLASGETDPLVELTYQRELAQIEEELKKLNADLRVAKAQLAALINLPPGQKFSLRDKHQPHGQLALKSDLSTMIESALNNRPEIKEAIYKHRIDQHEADAALLELLPGIQVFLGPNWNTNDFLFNSNWIGWGAKASWNVMKVFQYPITKKHIEARSEVLRKQTLALTMAVMTQIHVSRLRHFNAHESYHSARKINRIQTRILKQLKSSSNAGAVSEHSLIREEMNTILSDIKEDVAYAELQSAYAGAQVAMGLDVYENESIISEYTFAQTSVGELANELRQIWGKR
ncbi:MAG: TolC family protein [Pseudomonadota bacterium]